jgi:hypothetical protein
MRETTPWQVWLWLKCRVIRLNLWSWSEQKQRGRTLSDRGDDAERFGDFGLESRTQSRVYIIAQDNWLILWIIKYLLLHWENIFLQRNRVYVAYVRHILSMWGLRYSRRWKWRCYSSGLWRHLQPSLRLNTERVCFSKTLQSTYESTRRHNPEE